MSDAGVARDHEIAVGKGCCCFQKIPAVIDLILTADESVFEGTDVQLLTAKAFLQREQGDVCAGGDRREGL